MTQAQAHILGMVGTIRRRWIEVELAWSAAWWLAGALAWLLAAIVLDNVFMLSTPQLLTAWVAGLGGTMGWLTWLAYRTALRGPSREALAILYERQVPQRRNRLINSVQFIGSGQAESDPFARAALEENAAGLDPSTAGLAVDRRPVRDGMTALAAAGALLLLYALARPAWTVNALGRLLAPLAPPLHWAATDIQVTPGNLELIEGQGLVVEARMRHNLPASASLEYRVGNLGWTRAPMLAMAGPAVPAAQGRHGAAAVFRYDGFTAVWQTLHYRVLAGRSASPTYSVTVSTRPRLQHIQVATQAPAYAGKVRKELAADIGEVTALAGSTVEVAITANGSLSSAALELSDGSTVAMEVAPAGGARAAGRFVLGAGMTHYAVRLTDAQQRASASAPRFVLSVLEDQPPLAVVVRPGRDLALPVDAAVDLALEAEDDVGLAWVALQVRPPGAQGAWRDLRRWDVAGGTTRRKSAEAELSLAALRLKPRDVLLYRAVAADRYEPKPHVYIGRTWTITVADSAGSASIVAQQSRRMLDLLSQILALQRENRTDLDMDRAIEPIRTRQARIRDLTVEAIAQERQAIRPDSRIVDELTALSDGLMVRARDLLSRYGGPFAQRAQQKGPVLAVMDQIIARLEALIGQVKRTLDPAEKAEQALEKLTAPEREQALKHIHDLLAKLRQFVPEQDKVIAETEELARKGENYTKDDLQAIERLKGTEDKWAEVFKGSVEDIKKLLEQGFADASIANDYKEMVEQIEEAAQNLNPRMITLAVPKEQVGLELAKELKEDMEMWLPSTPDNIKWVLEEPPGRPDVPMPPLPEELSDLIGDLISDSEKLAEEADDVTSSYADSISAAGWGVSDGPISNFSAKGKTGNQLPNNNELSGRSGEGRTGRSQGQMVQDVARGLDGRKTPTRVTNDPFEEGVVKELQQQPTGGATGGGKGRGAGQEGLQGSTPPPLFEKLQTMQDWQQRLRQKAEQVAGQLKTIHVVSPNLEKAIELMRQAEQSAADGRYVEMAKTQQMVVQQLQTTAQAPTREAAMRIDRAVAVPPDQRRPVLEAMDEPVPQEYREAVRRYFEQLSEDR